jgi:hypothetical protein
MTNNTKALTSLGLNVAAVASGIGGVMYANKKGYGGWGMFGMFLLFSAPFSIASLLVQKSIKTEAANTAMTYEDRNKKTLEILSYYNPDIWDIVQTKLDKMNDAEFQDVYEKGIKSQYWKQYQMPNTDF